MSRRTMFCCRQMLGELPILQTGNALVPMQGTKVHGCYYPLTREQLEWQISINNVPEQVEKELNEFMQASLSLSSEIDVGSNFSLIWISNSLQEAGLEIQQLCEAYSWLTDIYVFTRQWNPSSLGSLLDQPPSLYDEHIKQLRHWTERISTVPSSISSSNHLFTVHCTSIKETLGMSALRW